MPEIVSDEYREGWTSFVRDVCSNPYEFNTEQYDDWEAGWLAAQLNWFELVDGDKAS